MEKSGIPHYEIKLVVLLSLMFGFVIFDRMALNFLVPFIDRDLHLTNTMIGMLNSFLALGWATSGYLMGTFSDLTGQRKKYLLLAVIIFSISSFLSGLATGFAFLLGARILMGFAEGPVLPLAQSIIVNSGSEIRRGLNMGFIQGFAANILATIAPLLLVAVATKYGWRNAFFLAGLPGLLLAGIGYLFIREPRASGVVTEKPKASLGMILKYRNIWISVLIGSCIMTWLFSQVTFLPKFLVTTKGFSEKEMAIVLSLFGLGVIVWGLAGPALSDRFGRKPVVIFSFLLGLLLPFGAVYQGGGVASLWPYLFLGAAAAGAIPIVLATIPSETIPRQYVGQALGLVMGVCELVGGVLAPIVAGWSADHFGASAPFFIAACAAMAASLFACLLFETAPVITSKVVT